MKNAINIIKEIYFTKVVDVSFYQQSFNGTVSITTKEWTKINKSAAPGTLNIKDEHTTAGRQYSSDISLSLKEPLIVPEPVILKIILCEGDPIIIGSVEL